MLRVSGIPQDILRSQPPVPVSVTLFESTVFAEDQVRIR